MFYSSVTVSAFILSLALAGSAQAGSTCPLENSLEKSEDCPWAGWSRDLEADMKLETLSPPFVAVLKQVARDKATHAVWGETLNFDENIKGEIVPAKILLDLTRRAGVPAPREWKPGITIVHAGVEHTFGYLFSTKGTPFGFKRARWVQDDIEVGFGLPRGALGPMPSEGNLLGNVSFFAASILEALDGYRALPKLNPQTVAAPIRSLPYQKLTSQRLEETFSLKVAGGKEGIFTLRTDLVPFPVQAAGKKNTHLLMYSVLSPATKRAQLFTVFPVETSFVGRVMDPTQLGVSVPIKTRYNAWVPGLTDATTPTLGKREIARGH